MYKIIFTESYEEKAKKFLRKHPELLKQYEKVFRLLEVNPFHPSLRLHKINLKDTEVFSVSINISYRIMIDLLIEENEIIPVNIGTHDDVYR
jgi:mRNA-degrading endonuclease YafQ of YafQ-DinJ toxin-antitoxin module